ncbi:MAG: right-handed parallel beta-helix repeat-containing protein [Chitinispirillaceae bacterium]|nr:right-handed parallel beta-helix repeat-containing protein [Chitinispirillaceae bacterium]
MNRVFNLLVIAGLIFGHCTASARTWYIDYEDGSDKNGGMAKKAAWKRCPGMTGFTGAYRHEAGDRFVFKGGCAWPSAVLPLVIKNSGADGAADVYTSDHTWYRGPSWTQPVFSGQHSRTPLLIAEGKSYFIVKDLGFIDFGRAGIWNGGKAIDINACSHYAITRCTIAPQAWIGLYLHSYSGATEENILIDQNDISASGQAIVIAVEAPNTRMHRVTVNNNAIHDLSSQIVGETHGDGIHTWNAVQDDRTQYISDLVISDNRFYGDFSCGDGGKASMTSLIYLTDPGKRARISGNVLTCSATSRFASLIWVRYFDSVSIVNNTLVMDSALGAIGIMVGQGDAGKRVVVKNNIIAGAKYCYYIYGDACSTTSIDNNNCVTTGSTTGFWTLVGKTWSEWREAGNDRNGISADPQFRSSTDLRLRSTSPCIGRADSLTGDLFSGEAAWSNRRDLGAFEFTKKQ